VKDITYYNVSTGEAQFSWTNITQGFSEGSVVVSSVNGAPISAYYDGSSADFIDERPTYGSTLYRLRDFGTAGWADAYTARAGMSDVQVSALPYDFVEMYNYTPSTDHMSGASGHALAGPANWNMHWLDCGTNHPK